MIALKHVRKTFGREEVLRDVSARFPRGMIHGLVGRNGSGKTVLLKLIAGLMAPDGGVIRVGVTENGAFREELSVSADEVLELCVYARVGSGLVYIKFKVREGEPERPEQILCRFTMGCIKEMGAFCKQVNYFFETGVLTGTDSRADSVERPSVRKVRAP